MTTTPAGIRTRLTTLALAGLSWILAALTILPGNAGRAVAVVSLVIIGAVGWEPLRHAWAGRTGWSSRPVTAAATALGLALTLTTDTTPSPPPPAAAPSTTRAAPAHPPVTVHNPALRVLPIAVHIPKLDASSSLIELGLDADRRMQTPPVTTPMQAGWYEPGPAPGQTGPAVIVGHVDGAHQPGIFYRLHELTPGDRITVDRADHSTVTFVVRRIIHAPKDHFPTMEVYGRTAGPELRLITCGGPFDRAARSYRENIIVFARLEGGQRPTGHHRHPVHSTR